MRLHYAKATNGPALHDALAAAGVPVERVETATAETWVTVPDGTDAAPIAAAVAAHDAAQASPADAADRTRTTRLDAALTAFRQADTDWATLTAAQKDQVLRHLVRAMVALLERLARTGPAI